jgi:tetratricopeptide (TPR) repeat protein
VQLFDDASHYDATRAEALVRKARMLEGSGRPAEAVAALDAIAPRIDDPAIAYWRCLFRGRALGDLDRFEEAARAFEDARRLVPDAQSATVALMALELRRNRAADAYVWADAVRKAPPGMTDPWWQYATGDFRFFAARLVTLRRMMRQ